MNVFMYKADLHCEDCGDTIRETLPTPKDIDNEYSYDSDDYPKGPYSNGGGESDCANHCGTCGVALDNAVIQKEATND